MTAPGVIVQVQTSPPSRSAPSDTGVAFIAGLTDQGPLAPVQVQSLAQFVTLCGARVSYSPMYDALDVFFREGGNAAYISRVVGPAPVSATFTFNGADANPSLIIKANSPGAWGNNLKVQILAGLVSGYRVQVQDVNGNPLETSSDLATQQDAVTWASAYSNYVVITIGSGSEAPAVHASVSLASGADDRADIVDANWLAALNLFTKDLGPGQVLAPGRTTAVGHTQLCDHAAANNRVALLDLVDDPVVGDLQTAGSQAASTGNGQYGGAYTPWVRIPGVTAGTTRVVSPAAAVAGVIARNDVAFNPNTAAAGKNGQFRSVIGLSQPAFSDSQRDTLNVSGINVIRSMFGGFRVYGNRSLADPVNSPNWIEFTVSRYFMWLSSRSAIVAENYEFEPIDGAGHLQSDYASDLGALCQSDYSAGILFGDTAEAAYSVDTGDSVNTPTTIALGQLRAVVAARPSPTAEVISILLVNTPITGSVS